jgi:hypothetical protein
MTTTTNRVEALAALYAAAARVGADFEVRVTSSHELAAILSAIGGHNDYSVRATIDALGHLVPRCMQVRVKHFTGGPSLHLQVPYWTYQSIGDAAVWGGENRKLTDAERKTMAEQIIAAGRSVQADEISTQQNPYGDGPVQGRTGDNPYEIRLWWD